MLQNTKKILTRTFDRLAFHYRQRLRRACLQCASHVRAPSATLLSDSCGSVRIEIVAQFEKRKSANFSETLRCAESEVQNLNFRCWNAAIGAQTVHRKHTPRVVEKLCGYHLQIHKFASPFRLVRLIFWFVLPFEILERCLTGKWMDVNECVVKISFSLDSIRGFCLANSLVSSLN